MALKLNVIICSTRPGRQGPIVARWFFDQARADARFDAELVDLADFDLPMFDEPKHPRLRQYEHEHTKRWSASVDAADAFVFVTPEYNYNPPPSFVNAMDYLWHEWRYKPAGLVSYGGVSGGLRSAQQEKLLITALGAMPIPEGVPIPMFSQQIKDGVFHSNELIDASVKTMLDELARWGEALKAARAPR